MKILKRKHKYLAKFDHNYFSKLNKKYHFFDEIIPLAHPRYIMQYKRKYVKDYIADYINKLGVGY